MSKNLLNMFTPLNETKSIPIGGSNAKAFKVYMIPIEELKYNRENGRISSEINMHNHEGVTDDDIQEMIIESDNEAFKKTRGDIKLYGQLESGVVTCDGIVIDGNRRFTCLRSLSQENPSNEQFKYFKAVILDEDYSSNPKAIKELELRIQHRKEKEVDYDPINKKFDCYRSIVINKYFTEKEYAENMGASESDINKWIIQCKIMLEFLEFINEKNNWNYIKKKKLDGSFFEIAGHLLRIKDDITLYNQRKNIIFTWLATKGSIGGDLSKEIRKFMMTLSDNFDNEQLSKMESYNRKIYDFCRNELKNEDDKINMIKSIDNDMVNDVSAITIKCIDKKSLNDLKGKPIELIEKSITSLKSIDIDILNASKSSKEKFSEKLNQLKKIIEDLEKNVK